MLTSRAGTGYQYCYVASKAIVVGSLLIFIVLEYLYGSNHYYHYGVVPSDRIKLS